MRAHQSDLTPLVDLTLESGAGPVRTRRPVYVDLMPPCNHACPVGEEIQHWLSLAQAGQYHQAWRALTRDNPLPAVHGRVCYQPCESACSRGALDASVNVHGVERFLGDLAAREGWQYESASATSGKRVLVVGSGPCGLSAAYHLARVGHSVEIHEAGPVAGGMMHFGIPAYRLPREDLIREISRIEATGVKIVVNHRVRDVLAEMSEGRFDAVFLAIGAGVARHIDIPARDAPRVLDAVSMLHHVTAGEALRLGRRVVVYGGGGTAMDAARTARRLGAEETLIVYRRDRTHMPAHAFELNDAIEEGVKVKWLSTIKEIAGPKLTVEEMELDAQGRPHATGRQETLEADAVVLAVGQASDSGFLRATSGIDLAPDGSVVVGPDMMTRHPGVFAGGDMVPGPQSVTVATGHGKRAARYIDAWLHGTRLEMAHANPLVTFDMLHPPVYTDAAPSAQPMLAAEIRARGFEEVLGGLTESQARYEAQRCLSCGNCFECDSCYAACPEQAIVKLGPGKRYRFEYTRCTGCAVCFDQCPCHAIEMIPEREKSD